VNQIPSNYLLDKFYTYAGAPSYNKYTKVYCGSCPVCREGKSWLKKKRLFFYPKSNSFYCFNCSKSWSAYSWLTTVCNVTKEEIDQEIATNEYSIDVTKKYNLEIKVRHKEVPDLPHDSINLFDELQQKYYSKNGAFYKAMEYVKSRRLHTAINKSPALYISLTDFYHKNRLVLPFYDRNKKIVFYQTRVLDNTQPKYLGKISSDKTVFGIDRIDNNFNYIFMFEGPIDSMFVKNGVSLAGLSITEKQKMQLAEFPFHKKIWVLDNPKFDETAKEKILELKQKGENVFNWPLGMSYKDLNEMAVFEDLDSIDPDVFIKNCY